LPCAPAPIGERDTGVTSAVHQVDPETPVVGVVTMEAWISASLSAAALQRAPLGASPGLALFWPPSESIACSLTAFAGACGIGIRMALGATPSDVLQMVVADGMKPILLGVALGLAAAFALSPL